MLKRFSKEIGLFFIISFNVTAIAAQQDSNNIIKNIVCLTTISDLKLEADFAKSVAPHALYFLSIRDEDSNKLIFNEAIKPIRTKENTAIFQVGNLNVVQWQPTQPKLYKLIFTMENTRKDSIVKKIGFRICESKNGNVYLNGKPVFLRGIAINPPGRGIPKEVETSRPFAQEYVRFMKSIHVNIIRIPDDETWYEVCDEEGMMVFGGNYAGSVNGEKPPRDYEQGVNWYKQIAFSKIASHPSLMIYAMTNEVPYECSIGEQWEKFLSYAHTELKKWDSTRLYIANAGYGYGKSGDICDLHRYWGWYYCTPFNFINIRDNEKIIPFKKKQQPVTFTECVGNYTGPDGKYNLTPDHKNPGSQLNWTGHAPWAIQAQLADEHQAFTLKQATEIFRRLRYINSELSGVFPFTILFYNWENVRQFTDMGAKPVTKQIKRSYNPVLISWECWTPNIYAGSTVNATVHIVNDNDDFTDLPTAIFIYELKDHAGIAVVKDTIQLPVIKYYDTWRQNLELRIPSNIPNDNYRLSGKIISDNKLISENYFDLFINASNAAKAEAGKLKNILVYDVVGATKKALSGLEIPFSSVSSLNTVPKNSVLIIGENSAEKLNREEIKSVKKFISLGGRMIYLRQDSTKFENIDVILPTPLKNVTVQLDEPFYPPPARPSRNGIYINPELLNHPVFDGITRQQLRVWSDYTNWNEIKPGFPKIYPVTDGYVPVRKEDLKSLTVIADYGVGLEGIALSEIFDGKGSVLVCGMDLARRAGLDPVADRVLTNLIKYACGDIHINHSLIDNTIVWGDYESEKGVLTGVNSGLMLNSVPIIPNNSKSKLVLRKNGSLILGTAGGFNTRPGVQYVAYGRRMYGPYYLRGFGNVPEPQNDSNNLGEGYFWCRIPPDKTTCSTLVWNPTDKDLYVRVITNDTFKTMQKIKPGTREWVNCLVRGEDVKVHFQGDRRLVLLQTFFK